MAKPIIPFFSAHAMHAAIREQALATLAHVYDDEWYILGEELTQFEQEYSLFNQVAHTIGVGNGLEALTLTLRALGIGPGDEVVVPANTYIATWLAVSHTGAVPVPVEPELATSNLDPSKIESAITARTRAVLPVHLYGQPCRMPEIMAIARQYDLLVIEDNAQAQGATIGRRMTGSFGIASGTSFYPTKNLGALGDGGGITTNDPQLALHLKRLRNYGSDQKNNHQLLGYNSRLDELQAAMLRIKLRHLPAWTAQRRQLAKWYNQYLLDVPDLRLPPMTPEVQAAWHLYVVHTSQRDALQRHLATRDIGTLVHYPVPPHLQPAYQYLQLAPGSLPIAETLAASCLSLPLWPGMTEAQVLTVAQAVREFLE